jgi:hypothetical protein
MKISHLQENLTPASAPTASVPGPKFGRSDEMLESGASTATAGVVATGVQRRGGKKSIFKGIESSKNYPNSKKAGIVGEGAINEDDLSEEQLQAKKRRKELFKRSKPRDIGNKPSDREIMAKEEFNGGGEYNDEIDMVQNNLHTIVRVSTHLGKELQANENMPEWVQEKIAVAKSMIVTVMNYMISQHERGNVYIQDMDEGQLEFNTPDPVIVVQDLKGNILDTVNLSVAAQKYKLGQPQNIKNQLAHQSYTKIGNYTISAPMGGQPQDKTTTGQKNTFATGVAEGWSQKYKKSINCSHPKGFSQKAHCAGKKKHNESVESHVMEMVCEDCGMCETHGDHTKDKLDELKCWSGYHRVAGTKAGFPGSCAKNKTNEEIAEEKCPHCSGPMFSEMIMNEKKDACYYKVKSRYKVWPSAYASGALVKCRNKGASNWGNGGQKSESMTVEELEESLHDWFNKEKWVRMDTKGNIKGPCAKEPGEGKPKCLPQSKAHSLGKKGRASAAQRKRREDPNPERSGPAINVNTKKKSNESILESKKRCMQCGMENCKCPGDSCKCKPIAGWIPNKGFRKAMAEGALKKLTK